MIPQHRDLHWGQILVKNVVKHAPLKALSVNQKAKAKRQLYMDDLGHGVQATVIDLGLSRMDAGDGHDGNEVQWTPFDDEVFMGEGKLCFLSHPGLIQQNWWYMGSFSSNNKCNGGSFIPPPELS